jgi:cell division protein FtsB
MKWMAATLLTVVLLLQYRLWLSEDGVREVARLERSVEQQKLENAGLSARNQQLAAEVADLKSGLAALEERARSELGMIGRRETFYQVVPAQTMRYAPPTGAPLTHTAAR